MPEPSSPRRAGAGAALVALALGLSAPAALAQATPDDPRWAGSQLHAPFDEPGHTVRVQPFTAAGTFQLERRTPTDHIRSIEVRVVGDPDAVGAPAPACELPEPVVVTGGFEPGRIAQLDFAVELEGITCNGSYLLEAEATSPDRTATLRQRFVVGMLPEAVRDLEVALDAEARTASISFRPLEPDELAPDALGYVVERSGPSTSTYTDVGTLGLEDEPRFDDDLATTAGGTYTYRVRALRAGVGGPERSSVIHTESATVTIDEPPTPPPEQPAVGSTRPRVRTGGGVAPIRRSTARPTTVTTIDTGFEETIDYGEPADPFARSERPGEEALAGQSIIQDVDEDGGLDLAAPAAGALVLLGWAGHIAYLNRLAKQL